jgi:hypothetical protein
MPPVRQAAHDRLVHGLPGSLKPSKLPARTGPEERSDGDMSDDQTFRAVWLVALLLMVVAFTIPLAGRQRQWLRQAAVWVLVGGFLFAFYRIAQWLWG